VCKLTGQIYVRVSNTIENKGRTKRKENLMNTGFRTLPCLT